ncbi:lactonase family protein [Jeotgalibaca caeni]|uniref:lactonase family protein n=1 Tax=Jeotgalibaca caeni TaxID=3028623 RepID=UPI00237DE9A6|nr:lactonase family protein [Jeotgalibaca caeni]MDE1549004.1 lactonase family protein [Jeotgalibaca caeni]
MEYTLYLGSYTKRESKGVHQITLDAEKKELKDYRLIAEVESPTYLTFSSDKETMYTISKEDEGAGITSFTKETDGTYTKKASNSSEAVPPCYISLDEANGLLFTASYHKGYVSVYKEQSDGSITLADRVQHEGSSTHENQDAPHVHYTEYSPDRKYLMVCDLGTDEVYSYTVSEDGKLTESSRYKAKPGTGPRHLVFHPNGTTVYLLGELSSEVEVLSYNKEDGSLTYQDRISMIPESHTSFNGGAAIRITKDGKYVYASNRGHDSIVVYEVSDLDDRLSLVEYVPTEGNTPRDFNFAPGERYLIVGHQDSDNLTLFERDDLTGKLTLVQKDVHAPECVCVLY